MQILVLVPKNQQPLPNFGDSNNGGIILPHAPYHSSISHAQVTSHMQNWEPGATVLQHPFPPQQVHPQVASTPLGSIQASKLSSQPFITEVLRQSHPADSSVQTIEQQLSSQLPSQTENNPSTVTGITLPDMPTSPQDEDFPECDWSEDYCPDHDKFVTLVCDGYSWSSGISLRSMPCTRKNLRSSRSRRIIASLSQLSLSSSQLVGQKQQETDHDHNQSETIPVVG